jgi:hypothetical protein
MNKRLGARRKLARKKGYRGGGTGISCSSIVLGTRSSSLDPRHSSLNLAGIRSDNSIVYRIAPATHRNTIGLALSVKDSTEGARADLELALDPSESSIAALDYTACLLELLLTSLALVGNSRLL